MPRKRIVVIYHYGIGNEQIAKTDYDIFYSPLKNLVQGISDLQTEPVYCPDVNFLIDKLNLLLNDDSNEELYLHFSGHGQAEGIPYNNWILQNQELAAILDHSKVKSCFFSSCESSELVKLVNERKVPVVIGTLGANAIENTFAIDFQIAFYKALLESRTFKTSFEIASSTINRNLTTAFLSKIFTRGEGGKEMEENEVNALQIIFSSEKNKDLLLVPTNFILEMVNKTSFKPYLLTWFDDPLKMDHFKAKFHELGFNGQFHLINIPDNELHLLNNRGDEDPIALGDSKLLICCSKDKMLPNELRMHLNINNIWKMDHYKILFGINEILNFERLIEDQVIAKIIPPKNIYNYRKQPFDLLENDTFLKMIGNFAAPFSDLRRTTLLFDSKPVRKELREGMDENKFIRVFFAKNKNERLVNFLVNWLRDTERLNAPPLVVDTHLNRQMSIIEELEKEIDKHGIQGKRLSLQLPNLFFQGALIIIRIRDNALSNGYDEIKKILESIESAIGSFQEEPPEAKTFLFFLQDDNALNFPLKNKYIYLKMFSEPLRVNDEMITDWKTNSLNFFGEQVRKEVIRVSKTIELAKIPDSCPSFVIEHICNGFQIPQKQILGI